MPQWEYLTVQFRIFEQGQVTACIKEQPVRKEPSLEAALSLLDELGEQGWELTTPINNPVPSPGAIAEYYLVFKRSQTSFTHTPSLRSTDGSTPLHITFQNTTAETVQIYWLDYQGQEVLYHTLEPAASYLQPTYRTHPWRIKDTSGRVRKEIIALQDADVVIIL